MINLFPSPLAQGESAGQEPNASVQGVSSPVEQASRASTAMAGNPSLGGSDLPQAYTGMSVPFGPPELDAQRLAELVCECHGLAHASLDGTHLVTVRDGTGQELMHYMGEYSGGRRHGMGVWQGGDQDCMLHYSGQWANGYMSGQGVFSWRHQGHSFEGIFYMGCPQKGVITTASCRTLTCSFIGDRPILSPGLRPSSYAAIDTDIDDLGNLQNPLLNSRVMATPEPDFQEKVRTPLEGGGGRGARRKRRAWRRRRRLEREEEFIRVSISLRIRSRVGVCCHCCTLALSRRSGLIVSSRDVKPQTPDPRP